MQNDGKEPSQIDKFREAARELETDDSEERFDATLERLGRTPPEPQSGSKKDKPGR